jgi:hypothetical protein
MAISANAVTLAQYALMSNDPLVQAVTFSMIEAGSVMQDVPFVNRSSLIAQGVRFEGNLPSVNWANVNEEGATTSGTPKAFQESAYILRNYIDTDHVLVEDINQIADPRGVQAAAFMRAASYDLNDKFINNNHASGNAKSIVGIRARIDDGTTYGVRSENKIDAGAVVMTTAATAANFGSFLEFVDQLLWSVGSPDGTGVVLYVNDVLQRRWDRKAREFSGQGGFSQAQDQLGRSVTRYKNAVIRDAGYKADQSTRIITSTEDTAGVDASSTYTSIYAVHYGMDYLFGWQFAPLQARDLGRMENGVIYRTFIEWVAGLYNGHTRSLGRVYGIKLA